MQEHKVKTAPFGPSKEGVPLSANYGIYAFLLRFFILAFPDLQLFRNLLRPHLGENNILP